MNIVFSDLSNSAFPKQHIEGLENLTPPQRDKHNEGETINMELAQEVSFLNKAAIKQTFAHLAEGSKITIDASSTIYIDHNVLQLIKEFFIEGAKMINKSVP